MGAVDNKMMEEALIDLREQNGTLRKNLDKHIQIGAEFSNIINEMLGYIEKKDKEDYLYFVKMVEKALERNR
jgi:hypothetical protein